MDLKELLKTEYDQELASTRKMLDAIPADADLEWKASDKNMTLGRLAAHTAEASGIWAVHTLGQDVLDYTTIASKPWRPASKTEILERFDAETAQGKALLADLAPEKWNDNWKMTAGDQVWINDSRYHVFRKWVLNHSIHHRAQLGRDLRTLGAAIPGMYGPSADQG